jgi:alpha-2-macroglobulin-like protein
MTQPFPDFDELQRLLDALCEESLTAEQAGRLEDLLLGHPEAEAYYVQYLALHADLVCLGGASSRPRGLLSK